MFDPSTNAGAGGAPEFIQRKQWVDSWLRYVAAALPYSTPLVRRRAYEAAKRLLHNLDEVDYNGPVRRALARVICEAEAEASISEVEVSGSARFSLPVKAI